MAQKKHLNALNTMKKTSAPFEEPILKRSRKNSKKCIFSETPILEYFLAILIIFFSEIKNRTRAGFFAVLLINQEAYF